MCREDEEADGHRRERLLERLVVAGEELLERDEIAERLAHLLSVDGYHVVVHPVLHHLVALTCHCLCDLALVMREYKVHATSVDVEMVAKILASHGGTLAVPSGETVAPRTWPAHNVLGRCLLPKGEIHLVALLSHSVKLAAGVDDVVEIAAREDAILMVLIVFLDIEIHRPVALVGVSVGDDLLHQLLLLDDVSRGVGLDARGKHVERLHGMMVAVGVVLRYLHWLQLLESRLLLNLVIALVGVVLEVSDIGDVTHIAHLVSEMLQIAEEDIERDGGTGVSKMRVAVNRWSADVHSDVG